MRQCCSPGSFVTSNSSAINTMYQIINACSISDRNMPNEKRTMLLRNASSKLQIVTAIQCKQMSDVEVEAPPLRQRCF